MVRGPSVPATAEPTDLTRGRIPVIGQGKTRATIKHLADGPNVTNRGPSPATITLMCVDVNATESCHCVRPITETVSCNQSTQHAYSPLFALFFFCD